MYDGKERESNRTNVKKLYDFRMRDDRRSTARAAYGKNNRVVKALDDGGGATFIQQAAVDVYSRVPSPIPPETSLLNKMSSVF